MRLLAYVSYDGALFSGWQKQANSRTVQEEIEAVLTKIHKKPSRIFGSGRTDAGVHAYGQTFHFDTDLTMPLDAWLKVFESLLPRDIYVYKIKAVDDNFHARFNALQKTYHYRIHQSRDVFKEHYSFLVPYELDVAALNEVCSLFAGQHNFLAFNSTPLTDIEDQYRVISYFDLVYDGADLCFRICGNGFLRYMVRMLVGTVLAYQCGKITKEEITEALLKGNKTSISFKVPAQGLYLMRVDYE